MVDLHTWSRGTARRCQVSFNELHTIPSRLVYCEPTDTQSTAALQQAVFDASREHVYTGSSLSSFPGDIGRPIPHTRRLLSRDRIQSRSSAIPRTTCRIWAAQP